MAHQSQNGPPGAVRSGSEGSMDRRTWMKGAAALVGGAAAGVAAPSTVSATVTTVVENGETVVETSDRAVVQTTAGKVRGFTRNGVFIYKGIPYGDTTAGANRFMPPQPPKPWTDVKSTVAWGPVSPHPVRAGWPNLEEQFVYGWDDGFEGEDMLRINVWTPGVNDNARRPVLVWIHGGGFSSGSSQELWYDGENLAKKNGVVLVSMNHRLNVFGFLDLSQYGEKYAASGNAGMLDLVQALQWVRDNIASFGGDPANVTIFGQSGGGGKVSTLMAMPAARGLFHKAAIMSGSGLRQGDPVVQQRLAVAVLEELGIGRNDLSRLETVPWQQLRDAGVEALRKMGQAGPVPGAPAGTLGPGWRPVVDGRTLPQHPFDPAAPAISANIPLMVGTTFSESNHGVNRPGFHLMTLEELRTELRPRFGARTDEVITAYQRVLPDARPFETRALILTPRTSAITQVERKAAQNAAPVYNYWFGWKMPVLDQRPLSFHCADLIFWFDNVDDGAQATGGGEFARELADRMSKALVAFARTGDPNHSGIPNWPAFTAANRATMVWNDRVEVKSDPDREARTLAQSAQLR
jgi:para-nitrobenzyl esterase